MAAALVCGTDRGQEESHQRPPAGNKKHSCPNARRPSVTVMSLWGFIFIFFLPKQELKSGDDRFVKDLRRQANEIDQMMQRSEELVSLLTQAYREELDQIEVRSRNVQRRRPAHTLLSTHSALSSASVFHGASTDLFIYFCYMSLIKIDRLF